MPIKLITLIKFHLKEKITFNHNLKFQIIIIISRPQIKINNLNKLIKINSLNYLIVRIKEIQILI